jgi:hypothetical protein
MTNTRITDVEIMERRYPVLVRTFAIRSGYGCWCSLGGNFFDIQNLDIDTDTDTHRTCVGLCSWR